MYFNLPTQRCHSCSGICLLSRLSYFFFASCPGFENGEMCVIDYFLYIVISINAVSTCLTVYDVQSSSISYRYIAYLSNSNILYMHVVRYF